MNIIRAFQRRYDRPLWRLERAEDLGYSRGYNDVHHEVHTFETGAEYIAWLRGWRKGQAALKAEHAKESAEQTRTERIMRELLEAA
jgi:ribosome modulation factor